ncbi:C69 family dipeptidase [Thioclava sp. GXIMD4215]|uniref:C69 family dipeptidase n=1 Tax=Thioclava sp. GXIMD4215 TaxID=3131928 RepID=UPI00311AD0F2
MCDTILVLGSLTQDGRSYFAKNSDRAPNEAQYLTKVEAASHASDARVQATYIDLPQVGHTYACIGSRPWWIWGFEHGVNEHGLTIGNEAVWSRLAADQGPNLLGMDLLRLTLERARDADEGLKVLTGLIETYGQGGHAALTREMVYHNAFLLADGRSGWVVESAGRHWVARKVTQWAAISNVYSIGRDYDLISDQAEAFATEQGWHPAGTPFDWARAYTDSTRANLPACHARLAMSRAKVAGLPKGRIGLTEMIDVLRDHGGDPDRHPAAGGQACVCMHGVSASSGSETAASMIVALPATPQTPREIWVSLASPCLSGFIPVWLDTDLPKGWSQPAHHTDPDQWWDIERLQRLIDPDYTSLARGLRAQFNGMTHKARAELSLASKADAATRNAVSQRAARSYREIVDAGLQDRADRPRSPDPRGDYLADINRAIPRTSRDAREDLALHASP